MSKFVFPVSGVHGLCCKGNLEYWLNSAKKPSLFTFKTIDISADYKYLLTDIEDDVTSEEDVRRYITQALVGTDYQLIKETAYRHWLMAGLGVGVGTMLLILSLVLGPFSPFVMAMIAVVSVVLTMILGAESWRKARTDLQRKTPAMDSLFVLSTATATLVSLAAFFIPGLPMMFEASLLIFGFRHLGLAIRLSISEDAKPPVRYQRLSSAKKNSKPIAEEEESLLPGDMLALSPGDMIPIDGWLVPDEAADDYWLDVSRVEGVWAPRKFATDEAVVAGMIAKTACKMRVGVGLIPQYFTAKPRRVCAEGDLWLYPAGDQIKVSLWSKRDSKSVTFELCAQDLMDSRHYDHRGDILTALRLNTSHHLAAEARQQLLRALAMHAADYGVIETSSFLQQLDEELAASAQTKTTIQEKTEAMLRYFVPGVLVLAVMSGLLLWLFFSPMIALGCVISILVSACPCTLGLIPSLVMAMTGKKGKDYHVIFSQPEAIQALTEIDTVVLDMHGTVTKGQPELCIELPASVDREWVYTQLALLEQQSEHYLAKAIYVKIRGDSLVVKSQPLALKTIERYPDGIGAMIEGQSYLLGNAALMQRSGIVLEHPEPGTTYFVRREAQAHTVLATITMQDPIREDALFAIRGLKKRGLTVYGCTGGDEITAKKLAKDLELNGQMYANRSGTQQVGKKSKVDLINELKSQGHRVGMIGDSANDVSAMDAAHASMIMDHRLSDDGARHKANIRILNGQLMSVVHAIDIAHQATGKIEQNLIFSLVYNLLAVLVTTLLALAFGVVLHPSVGAALMTLQIGLILLNTYRFRQQPLTMATVMGKQGLFAGLWAKVSSAANVQVPLEHDPHWAPHGAC